VRVLIFARTTWPELVTQKALRSRGWVQLSASTMEEFKKAIKNGVDVALTPLQEQASSLPDLVAELGKVRPTPKLMVYTMEHDRQAEFDSFLKSVDLAFVLTTGDPRESSDAKVRYCREGEFGEALIKEIELIQVQPSTVLGGGTAQVVTETPLAEVLLKQPQEIKYRPPAHTNTRSLVDRTCPYPHRSAAGAPAFLEPATKDRNVFIDALEPTCLRPIHRCPVCKASNRAYARYCRHCGADVDFTTIESALYKDLRTDGDALRASNDVDIGVHWGMVDVASIAAIKGFLWVGGTREDGAPILACTCTGETFRRSYSINTRPRPDAVLGIEPAEHDGSPILLITTKRAIHELAVLPQPTIKQEVLRASPDCEFRQPAVLLGGNIVAIEYDKGKDNYFLLAGSLRQELGNSASELVRIDDQRSFCCTSRSLWVYDARLAELTSVAIEHELDTVHRPIYDARQRRIYIKSAIGIGMLRLDDPKWWMQTISSVGHLHYAFCIDRSGNYLWVHNDLDVFCYSTAPDSLTVFDSRVLHYALPFSGIAPVEVGGLLFVTSRNQATSSYQLGVLNPRGAGRYSAGETVDRVVMPPILNLGFGFVTVRNRGRFYLKRYTLA